METLLFVFLIHRMKNQNRIIKIQESKTHEIHEQQIHPQIFM